MIWGFPLEIIWYVIVMILVTGYVVLDGFDLGVGILHLFSKKDEERRIMLNSIGPVWDGNEVWLVCAGGALFAGFPIAYASICSTFYIPLMVLLCGIIFRAVAIEFRSKRPFIWWRKMWDTLFSLASFVIALGLGVVLGNLVSGVSLNSEMDFNGTFLSLIHPYALLTGFLAAVVFAMHGLLYILLKTEGDLHKNMKKLVYPIVIIFLVLYSLTTVTTIVNYPHMTNLMRKYPLIIAVAVINLLAVINIPRAIAKLREGQAFISSCVNIVCLFVLFALGIFPYMLRATNDAENLSVTIWNAASSEKTLIILLIMVLLGLPLVLSYTVTVYWVFRGRVKLHSTSY